MNTENLKKLRDHLSTLKAKAFNMEHWFSDPEPECGTVACIAGWTTMLLDPQVQKIEKIAAETEAWLLQMPKIDELDQWLADDVKRLPDQIRRLSNDRVRDKAQNLLGIDDEVAEALFIPPNLNYHYTPEHAVKAIDLVLTGATHEEVREFWREIAAS